MAEEKQLNQHYAKAVTVQVKLGDDYVHNSLQGKKYLLAGSLSITSELNNKTVCSLILKDFNHELDVQVGQKLIVTYYDNDQKNADGSLKAFHIFGGQVDRPEYRYPDGLKRAQNGKAPRYIHIKAVDWSCLLDRIYVNETINKSLVEKELLSDLYPGTIIKYLIAKYTKGKDYYDASKPAGYNPKSTKGSTLGINCDNVKNGPKKLEEKKFNNITITDCLNDLAQETGCKWYIDPERKLYFRSENDAPFSGWNLVESEQVDLNRLRNVRNIRVIRERAQYRNKQTVVGEKQSVNFYYPPDGWSKDRGYKLTKSYEIELGGEIRDIVLIQARMPVEGPPEPGQSSVKTAWEMKSIGIEDVESKDTPYYQGLQFVYTPGDTKIKYVGVDNLVGWEVRIQGKKGVSTQVTQKLDTECFETHPGSLPDQDLVEKRQVAERDSSYIGTGIYEHVEVDERLTSKNACEARALALLGSYGTIATIVRFETGRPGLCTGERLKVNSKALGIENEPQKIFMIRSISITDVDGIWLNYNVEAVGSEAVNWKDFFRKLAKGTASGLQSKYKTRDAEMEATPVDKTIVGDSIYVNVDAEYLIYDEEEPSKFGQAKFGFAKVCD